MAKATAKTKSTIESVTLELSFEEACVLRDVMSTISGNPERTRRGLTNLIDYALGDADVPVRFQYEEVADFKGGIAFI